MRKELKDFLSNKWPLDYDYSNSLNQILLGYISISNEFKSNIEFCQSLGICFSWELVDRAHWNTVYLMSKYDPQFTKEDIEEGVLHIQNLNKQFERTGKVTKIKIGRFLSKFPYLTDKNKEKIVTDLKEIYEDTSEYEFKLQDDLFEQVVTMKHGKARNLATTNRCKSLNNSCMRYKAVEMNLDRHPYEAYNSGDFYIAYLYKDKTLYARTIIHKASMTHAPIYCTSLSTFNRMEEELSKLDVYPVDEEGTDWVGAKLLHIETNYYEYDSEGTNVLLAPYLDFYEEEFAYTDGEYIRLGNGSGGEVLMQCGDGFVEW